MSAKKDTAEQKGTLARVLVDFPFEGKDYAANDLVEFPAGAVETLKKSGVVDDSEAAIAYCAETLGKKPVVHVPESAEQEPQGEAK